MIALVDYGAGNLTSVRKAFAAVQAEIYTPATPADLQRAQGVVVPGVGHFASTRTLDQAWRHAILERLDAGRPLLGICVGLQWLFAGSTEAPDETAHGDWMKLVATAGLQWDTAILDYLAESPYEVERRREPFAGGVSFTLNRARPPKPKTDKPEPTAAR